MRLYVIIMVAVEDEDEDEREGTKNQVRTTPAIICTLACNASVQLLMLNCSRRFVWCCSADANLSRQSVDAYMYDI